jgi:predicted small secreted protein
MMTKSASIIIVLAIASFIVTGCRSNKDATTASDVSETVQPAVNSEPQLLASIQRTACYGQCPMYKATFLDNGEVIYIGKRFVEHIGTYRTLLSEEEVLDIKKKITEYDYFGLDSLYPTPITDFPSCITEAGLNGKTKKVIDRRNPPDNLKAFEKFLDSLLVDKHLEMISEETNYPTK